MTDFERLEEKASLYVMDEMDRAERREFEAAMGESAELTQVTRELEEGATAVALACPPRRPPPFMWERIERAVKDEQRKIVPLFGTGVWRNAGWAAAAACLAAWFFFGNSQSGSRSDRNEGRSVAGNSRNEITNTLTIANSNIGERTSAAGTTNEFDAQQARAREREAERLRADIEHLQRQVGRMSQVLTQQQAMLGEPNRIKFLTLAPTANAVPLTGLSPQLQRALFLAMARELGWLNSSNEVINPRFEDAARQFATDAMNVDFVDLRNTNGAPVRFKVQKETENTDIANSARDDATIQLASALPAFATADHVVVALDSTIAPTGSELLFSLDDGTEVQPLGSGTMGSNPMVITFQSTSGPNWTFQVGVINAGNSNLLEFAPIIRASP